jgi:hypothetical protein
VYTVMKTYIIATKNNINSNMSYHIKEYSRSMCSSRNGVTPVSGFVTRLTRRVPLAEQQLPNLTEHQSLPRVFSGVRITRSLALCVCFVDRCLSFCPFSFSLCVVCPPSIYGFSLPLWYLQTLLPIYKGICRHAIGMGQLFKLSLK